MTQDEGMTTEEDASTSTGEQAKRKTPSVAALKQAAIQTKLKEQQKRYDKATKWRRVTEEGLGDLDLEEAMEKTTDEAGKMTSTTTAPTTVMTMIMTTASISCVVTAEVYSKPYTKSAEQRGERSTARSERREN